ncbi:hypothetical protein JTB14_003899 [Gonioctena quinquepunctata]|nr:hypothetical protein JTB14_003899 [Gonioctena quinquepunctata]
MTFGRRFLVLTLVLKTVSGAKGSIDNSTTDDGLAAEEDFLHQASLHLSYNNEFICGGSIVSSTQILTVAHCLFYSWGGVLPPIIISVQGGRKNINDDATYNFAVRNVTFHPSFNKVTLEYDLAVVEINGHFPSNVQIQAAGTEKLSAPASSFDDCFLAGWDEGTLDLRISDVDMVECDDVYSDYMGNICAQNKLENDSLCTMSPGSSLVCDNNLIGVLSIEANCNDTRQITVFESIRYAGNLLNDNEPSSAPIDYSVVRHTTTIWSLISALLSFVMSLILQ